MKVLANNFVDNASVALGNEQLQRSLGSATRRFRDSRHETFASFDAGDGLRDRARAIKAATLARPDFYLDRLGNSLESIGGVVHWAEDAHEARQLVLDIAAQNSVRLAVKSKSMTTEEIGLNSALETAGIETVETDLGEFIIQLADETPSHIIAPAIHKNKADVHRLFVEHLESDRLGDDSDVDHVRLTQVAREHLRDRFRSADLGITGVNFAVADTGTLAIVENEGNARLVTSLPRIHVAIMGFEKVIPTLADLAVFLRILAPSATGQKASSYVSLINGPRRAAETDGPEQLHLIILDNGRSRLLADPELYESLMCIRCGACLNACPVYRFAGGHSYGSIYPGPIGSVITPSLAGRQQAHQLPFASSLCGACREVCPVRIDLPRLLVAQREKANATPERRNWLERRAVTWFSSTMCSPLSYRLWTWFLRRVMRSLPAKLLHQLPILSIWARNRDLPKPPSRTFRQRWLQRTDAPH